MPHQCPDSTPPGRNISPVHHSQCHRSHGTPTSDTLKQEQKVKHTVIHGLHSETRTESYTYSNTWS